MPNTTVTSTFILRFWREQAGAETRWRGRIEHVPSGQWQDFLALDALLGYLRRFGIPMEDFPGPLADSERSRRP